VHQVLGVHPDAAERLPLLDTIRRCAARGLATVPLGRHPNLEAERRLIGHALIQLALRGDPELLRSPGDA